MGGCPRKDSPPLISISHMLAAPHASNSALVALWLLENDTGAVGTEVLARALEQNSTPMALHLGGSTSALQELCRK